MIGWSSVLEDREPLMGAEKDSRLSTDSGCYSGKSSQYDRSTTRCSKNGVHLKQRCGVVRRHEPGEQDVRGSLALDNETTKLQVGGRSYGRMSIRRVSASWGVTCLEESTTRSRYHRRGPTCEKNLLH